MGKIRTGWKVVANGCGGVVRVVGVRGGGATLELQEHRQGMGLAITNLVGEKQLAWPGKEGEGLGKGIEVGFY